MSTESSASTYLTARLTLKNATPHGTARADALVDVQTVWAHGIGRVMIRNAYQSTRQLAAGATDTLALRGSALDNALGEPLNLESVKILIVESDEDNDGLLIVGGAAADPFVAIFGDASDTVAVRPGGVLYLIARDADGYAVSDAAKNIAITNNGAAVATYSIVVGGC